MDPLEEVIVGNPANARFPYADPSTQVAEYPGRPLNEIPQGPFPQYIIDETEEDLDAFVQILKSFDVTVKRPTHGLIKINSRLSIGNRGLL